MRSNIKSLLKKTFDFIHNNLETSKYSTHPTFFTRNRTLTFPVVVSSILNLFKESVEYNLNTLLPCLNLKPVTGAAFSLARYKISLSFFKDLNKILVDFHQKAPAVLWKGFQLIAGDGSTVSLPASSQVKDHFGVHSTNDDRTARVNEVASLMYQIANGLGVKKRRASNDKSCLPSQVQPNCAFLEPLYG